MQVVVTLEWKWEAAEGSAKLCHSPSNEPGSSHHQLGSQAGLTPGSSDHSCILQAAANTAQALGNLAVLLPLSSQSSLTLEFVLRVPQRVRVSALRQGHGARSGTVS